MKSDTILLTEKDYLRLKNTLSARDIQDFEDLDLELERAKIISETEVPPDLVTMNTKLRYKNLSDSREQTITIVFPADANTEEQKVSVLAPIGSALIGLRQGQAINWMFPGGKTRRLEVIEVLYQPEAQGDWEL